MDAKWEFPRHKLRQSGGLEARLGEGGFGQVWKFEADNIDGNKGTDQQHSSSLVAIFHYM